jgi:integrase
MPGSTVKVRRRLKDGSVKTYTYERRQKRAAPGQGSMAWLVREYLKSPDFTGLKPGSQRVYRVALRYVEPIRLKPVGDIQRVHILKIRDYLASRPALANLFVSVIGAVFRFALERGHRADFNPADSIRPIRTGEGEPWPPEALAAAREHLAGPLRLAFLLGLHLAQRRGDVLALTWAAYRDGCISLVQQKTGTALTLPVAPELAEALESCPRNSIRIVGLSDSQFASRWPRAMEAMGCPGLPFHGLRHTGLTYFAEMGMTLHELQAIGGHASLSSLQRYTKAAAQKKLAQQGMAKVFDFAAGAKGQKGSATG